MATNWTDDQRNAIYDDGGTLLVSAAAGSGKTAVLVERVIQKLIDKENPVAADRLLIVTFSNAAAAEMRARIFKKLSQLSSNPEYKNRIAHQLLLLDTANISTIHAFCIRILRRNFHVLGLSPTFGIADENEIAVLKTVAINNVIKEYYAQNDPCFLSLVELLSTFRDDNNLVATVLKLYKSVRAYPFFHDWLKERLEEYSRAQNSPKDSLWADVILNYSADALRHAKNAVETAISKMRDCPQIFDKYKDVFLNDSECADRALKCANERDLDGLYKTLNSHVFERLPSIRACEDKNLQEFVKKERDLLKSIFTDVSSQVCTDEKTFKSDIVSLLPKIEKLFELTLSFSDRLDELKRERNILDFSDIEQLTLELLIKRTDNGYERSELAKDLSDEFDEILIDEYQDTNAAQDMIFNALSKDGDNLFMVGDVKQSIYQFRQAMPQLFIDKQHSYHDYDGVNYPALIRLSKNFRSRFEVTSAINFFFSVLMSEDFGQVAYSDGEELVCGANYPPSAGLETDIDILSTGESEDDSPTVQAKHIAKRISEFMTSLKVTDKVTGELREVQFSDIAVLMRAPKNVATQYITALCDAGIPAHFNNSDSCLNSAEIMTLLSLLRVINNPTFDVDLLTVLYSFIYSFNSDDLAKIRLVDRKSSLYANMLIISEDGSHDVHEKCRKFTSDIMDFRHNSSRMRVYELIEYIYQKTHYPSLIAAKFDDDVKVKNLSIFKDFAVSFQSRRGASLTSFIRYIDRVIESGGDLPGANLNNDSANAVQIMSIHRSKGLEFPICFIADLSKNFNKIDIREGAVLHSKLGFACVKRDEVLHAQYNTIPLMATRLAMEDTALSEELRMLYVALTRAKEKLVLVIPSKNPQKIVSSLLAKNPSALTTPYILKNCSSFAQWILLCLLKHPASKVLEGAENVLCDVDTKGAEFSLKVFEATSSEEVLTEDFEDESEEYDREIEEYMKESYSYVYPHIPSTEIFAKASVSDITKKEILMPLLEPQFEKSDILTGAKKGTAIHKFMQYCDYKRAKEDASAEIERLRVLKQLSDIQAKNIDISDIQAFFATSLADEIFASDDVRREMKFTMLLDAKELNPNADDEDSIILQGIADCVFKSGDSVVVLDFKSDKVKRADELTERYSGQLRLYEKALKEIFQVNEVKQCIYSFTLKQVIELK